VRRYLTIFRASLQINLAYRAHFLFLMLGNAVFIVVTWFLWKGIYGGRAVLNGMSFERTFTYLSLAMSVFVLLQTWVEWGMSQRIISGDIVVDFLRPLDYMAMQVFDILGFVAGNLVAIALPSFLIVVFAFGMPVPLGINIPLCLASLAFSFLISFSIDFLVGNLGFYTESTWGISMTKEVIVLSLSGALVPLGFYPEGFRRVLEWLPFQAIYNAPLNLLMDGSPKAGAVLGTLGAQAAWAAVLVLAGRAAFARASRAVTVNGG
jgi:ABC-2 type transport system permease protein